ncbi:MAG: glycosyltransferase [Solirubrobacterales bacterium]
MRTLVASEVEVAPLSIERMQALIDPEDWVLLMEGLAKAHSLLDGRQLWNVNSTAAGGGVAEMLRSWVGLAQGLGFGMRWLTISGDPEFFELTKRIHNMLHGSPGDGGGLGEAERAVYERVGRENSKAVLAALSPDDVVFLHDPQTAALAPAIAASGHKVVWRCHVGTDEQNEHSLAAWEFLSEYVRAADAAVFSRQAYVPECCEDMLKVIVPPSIDALSPKNQEIEDAAVDAILYEVGLLDVEPSGAPEWEAQDGSTRRVARRAEVFSDGRLPGAECAIVTQVSRWDRLKDPVGVMRGFALAAADGADAHLILAGPGLGSVADDPEGAAVFAEVESEWRQLPDEVRARVHLACLPMEDLEENAVIVNALQRRATIVVQKSLKEGFGLTVTEAMWKARPVVASAIGGILDQIEDGVSGVLLHDPIDLERFGAVTSDLLAAPGRAREIGVAAKERVRKAFLENRHTLQYVDLLERLLR